MYPSPFAKLTRAKEVCLLSIMVVIMFLTGTYVGVDWSMYFHPFQSAYPDIAGYVRTCLCAVVVLIISPNFLDRWDARLLSLAFLLTLVADYFLILIHRPIPGTLLFVAVHTTLIVRHLRGWKASLQGPGRAGTVRLLVGTGVVAYGGTALLLWSVADILVRTGMLVLDAIYLGFLATSLWSAWGARLRNFFPHLNGSMIAVGMTFFYFCDVTVGLAVAHAPNPAGLILSNVVAFFYTPALVLVSLSGYRWRPVEPERKTAQEPSESRPLAVAHPAVGKAS